MTGLPDPTPSYDRVAQVYEDRFADELQGKPRDRELLAAFADDVDGNRVVVDLGCGPGQIGGFVAAHRSDLVVAGLDRSREMARRAASRLEGGAVVGDLRALPFADASLAGVTAFYCLIHLSRPDLLVSMNDIARVLTTDGRVLLTAHEGDGDAHADEFLGQRVSVDATLFQLDELADACDAAGLHIEVAERRPPYEVEGPSVRLTVLAVKR